MEQLLLFRPRAGLEDAYCQQLPIFMKWAQEGKITWQQFQNFRRQAEYNLIMRRRRAGL